MFRMEGFMAELCELKSYRKTSKGLQFERKRKIFDDFVRFKKDAKKPNLPSGLSFEVSRLLRKFMTWLHVNYFVNFIFR